ncbi:MAG: hypothetical protein QM708_11765 [Propioniciclava sp.]|uniref:hypothetical protein n=1 Tax=Propioniciclava sp. TaxID=2038686 RepID=UPI0039E516EA
MTPPQWGIPVVLALGVVVIAAGWWWDRRRYRRLGEGFTTEEDLAKLPTSAATDDASVDPLLARRPAVPTLPAGVADPAFLTHPARNLAVAGHPLVLVTDAALSDDRLLIPLLAQAREHERPLVLVAPDFSTETLGMLRANLLTERVRTLPIHADPALLPRAAEACGCLVVPDADLRAGWLPAQAWGAATAWVADLDQSWVIDDASELSANTQG